MAGISIDHLRSLVSYDPETGIVRWIKTRNNRTRAGRIAGTRNNEGYLMFEHANRTYKCHRVAWALMTGRWPNGHIDHINFDRADNRWANLREATHGQNRAHSACNSTSSTGVKGVSRVRGRYRAMISNGSRTTKTHLGYYDTIEAASKAYRAAALARWGEFAAR